MFLWRERKKKPQHTSYSIFSSLCFIHFGHVLVDLHLLKKNLSHLVQQTASQQAENGCYTFSLLAVNL